MNVNQLAFGTPEARQETQSNALRRRSAVTVNKTLKVLDDALTQPVRTPARALNVSHGVSGRPDYLQPMMMTPEPSRTFGNDTLASRLGLSGASMLEPTTPGSRLMTSQSSIRIDEPEIDDNEILYPEFMDCMKAHSSEHQVLELLDGYEKICADQISSLERLVNKATPGKKRYGRTSEMKRTLDQEHSTWALLAALFKDQIDSAIFNDEEDMMVDNLFQRDSDRQIVDKLYDRDTRTRHGQIVIDWLEKKAQAEVKNYYSQVEFFVEKAKSWENTLHILEHNQNRSMPDIVNHMDPDAPIREKKSLADMDKEDEERLLKYLFVHVRAGQLDEAQKLCISCGQAWRAATLEGWKLHHDPNLHGLSNEGSVLPTEGNPYRDVWKNVCWKMAGNEKFDVHERAIYAAISGNLNCLLPACTTWEDYLWAYFKVAVDCRVEHEIRACTHSNRPLKSLPEGYPENPLSWKTIFEEIESSSQKIIRQESKDKHHILQKYIILGEYDGLLQIINSWISVEEGLPSHLLRCFAHLVLFFRFAGIIKEENDAVPILEAYVKVLIDDFQKELVATYVSTLPADKQVHWYAFFLEGVHERSEREHCLELGREAGLDIPLITKTVVENIRQRGSGNFGIDHDVTLEGATSEEDALKIEAIEWLVFDPTQRAEGLRQANAIMRSFLAMKKLSAARRVFNKIPAGSIDVIHRLHERKGAGTMPADDDNAIREYLCIQGYLDAHDSFNDWFKHFHHAKPPKPEIPAGANFTERVAYEHKERQYDNDLERWKHSLDLQTQTTVERIYNVLLFVDGGWMVDNRTDGEPNESRTHQMYLLRQLCLPNLCFLLHSVLQSTENYQECMKLANVIGSEQHQLFKVFRREEIQKLLMLFKETSIALLDKGLDPFGYELY